jgi:uncharacterized protein (TIGR03437 family)
VNGEPYREAIEGTAQISHNGRYVWNYESWFSMASGRITTNELRDLHSGAKTEPPVTPLSFRQAVTNDGSLLGRQPERPLVLWSAQRSRDLIPSEPPSTAIVNATATQVVYESTTATGRRLRAISLASATDTLLAVKQGAGAMQPFISSDGTLVLYLAEPEAGKPQQAWLVRPDGSERRQLTSFPEGIEEAKLDGLGVAVFAATGGRLVRVDVQTGRVEELVPKTPTCWPFSPLIPGSSLNIRGQWLASSSRAALFPLPAALDGVRVLADKTALPILSVAPGEIWFQVPFELHPGRSVRIEVEHSSPFEVCAGVVPVRSRQVYFLSDAEGLILAHEGFRGRVSLTAPVQPGEVIHAYAVGLGAVTPEMQTGVPTPAGRLYQLSDPFDCQNGVAAGETLEVPFAGLAPGLIGIYQVDVRMPSPLPSQVFLNCGTTGNAWERHGGGVPVPR